MQETKFEQNEKLLINKKTTLKANDRHNFDFDVDYGLDKKICNEPKDRLFLVYMIFLLNGIAVLLPYNLFLTASQYYTDYKLNTPQSETSWYRRDFTFWSTLAGQIANVIMNAINTFCRCGGGNPSGRIPYAIMLSAIMLITTIVLAIIDSSSWPFIFFIVTIVVVVISMIATGIYNTSMFYVSSMFPSQYTNALVFGSNIAGIFTSVLSIISKATSPDLKTAAVYYFLSGVIVVLLCFVLYFLMPRIAYYKYQTKKAQENARKSTSRTDVIPYFYILKQIWVLLFCIWLTLFSTLAIFPVFQLGILQSSDTFIVPKNWFIDITCFLTFNVFITIGNTLTAIIKRPGPKWIVIPVVFKALLSIAFFLVCNYRPDERNHIPILITNDYVYWAGCVLTPLVTGYLISLLMMYTPRQVDEKYAGTAAMLSALSLVTGVVCGLQFSKVLQIVALF